MRGAAIGVVMVLLLARPGPATAQEGQWPLFRGPDSGAVADDPRLPETWSETEHIVWKADIPGLGWSSPVVWDDHIFLTTALSAGEERAPIQGLYDPGADSGAVRSTANHRWLVYDLAFETGDVRWVRELHTAAPALERHLKNSYASETPVTDGERLYVYLGSLGLVAALESDGRRGLDPRARGLQRPSALRERRLAGAPRRAAVSRQRQHDAVVSRRPRRCDRSRVVAGRTGRGRELGHPIHLGERSQDRDRHGRAPPGTILRSRRAVAVGARRDDAECGPDAVRAGRAGLHQLRIPGVGCPDRSTRSARVRPETSR